MVNNIRWTPNMVRKLIKARNKAIELNKSEFEFEGQVLLVSYANYLIEYLEGVFGGV